jgi:hypothetical protein
MDGNQEIVGGMHTGTMYPAYRAYFDQRKRVASPFEIRLGVSYDTASRTGTLTIVARNTGTVAITGQLHAVITESHIYQVWQNMDSVHHVERNMLPSAAGEAVTVAVGDSAVRTRDFAIDAAWVARNCKLIAFIQNNSTKEIYQGAVTDVIERVELAYAGYTGTYATPGADVDLAPAVRNIGSQLAVGVSATLTTTDPYVAVTAANQSYPEIAVAQDAVPNAPFQLHVDAACPSDHVATLNLDLSCGDDYVANLTLPVLVTAGQGLSEDVEQGVGGWTSSGINSLWAQTTTRSHSATHSWGTTASGQYPNETDMRLLSPYFVPGDAAQLSYWQWYAVEQDYDYCLVELNTGGPFWVPIASFTGSAQTWTQQTFGLERYAGSTLRVRFRFISDSSVQGQGWFIDDIIVTPYLAGIVENDAQRPARIALTRNPVRGRAEVSYAVPAGTTAALVVYDASGRAVVSLGEGLAGCGQAAWDLTDASGQRVSQGTYFVRLTGAGNQAKVVLTR